MAPLLSGFLPQIRIQCIRVPGPVGVYEEAGREGSDRCAAGTGQNEDLKQGARPDPRQDQGALMRHRLRIG